MAGLRTTTCGKGDSVQARLFRALATALLFIFWLLPCYSATFTASLDRDSITVGESANLALTFSGMATQVQPPPPQIPSIPNLQVAYIGPSSQISIANNRVNATVTHNYRLAARQPGDYTIPALIATVDSEQLSTQPVTLRVNKTGPAPTNSVAAAQQLAFLRLVVPKREGYVGETLVAQLQLHVRQGVQSSHDFQFTSDLADASQGWLAGKTVQGQQSQAQVGNAVFAVVPLYLPIKLLRAGTLDLGPITASLVLELPLQNRRRDPFDPFEMLGPRTESRQVALASDAAAVKVLPLPDQEKPPGFTGAVGSFSLTVNAGPTNLTAGDPITLKVQVSGRGTMESVSLPEQPGWANFKVYPPTVKLENSDSFGLQGTKTFEQVIIPESADVKAVPPITFSFFDPDQRKYRSLTQPAIPLLVRPAAAVAAPTFAATRQTQDQPSPAQDIVQIKQRLGTVAMAQPPLFRQPWFLALQGVPVLALLATLVWRRRKESLARNPRLRRQREVAVAVRDGLTQLRRLAAENDSEQFFSTLFRLLQERLGERLNVPATSITEAVIDERLRPANVNPDLTTALHDLFQTCNLARYAPIRSTQELTGLSSKAERVLEELKEVEL